MTTPGRLTDFLAPARIARYRSFLKLKSDEEVYNAYCWNYAIAAAAFPLLGCIEMHLRDAVHKTMSQRYAPAGAVAHTYAWYDWNQPAHYPLQNKAYDDIEDVLYDRRSGLLRTPAPSTDDVVAAMTFGFWTNLFRTFSPLDAPQIIPAVFPHHHVLNPNQWGNKKVRTALNDHLRVVNDFRNRVAHHEPLFKFRYAGAYPNNLAKGLSNLRACMKQSLKVSEWIDPAARASLERSLWYQNFDELTTVQSFQSWTQAGIPVTQASGQQRCPTFATRMMLGA